MSQESQGTDSTAMENAQVKRKRGRPRKDENLICREPAVCGLPVIDTVRRNQRLRIDQTTDAIVGQVVSGVLEGSFDAGYLLTVRVSDTNTVLKGVVFEPGLSVPISVANDVAPHVKMFMRNEIPLPVVDLPTQMPGPNVQSKQNYDGLIKVSRKEGSLPSKVSPPVNQVARASPLSPSQVQTNTMAFSKGEINGANCVPKTAPQALQPEDDKAKSSPSLPAKGMADEANSNACHAVQVSLQSTASQTKNRMPTDVLQKDKPGLPTSEPEGLPVDANQVVQVSTQTAAPQIERKKSTDLLSNDKSELPTSEVEGVPIDINRVVHVPFQAAASQTQARKSTTNVLPNDKFDLSSREPEEPPGDTSQLVEDYLQGAASQSEDRKSNNVLPEGKVDLLTTECHGSNQASLIKPVVQPELKGKPSATQPGQLEHERAVEPAEVLLGNEAAARIRGDLSKTNAPEDLKFIPGTEPSVEKLPGSESIDQLTQVQQHMMVSELGPDQHADDAMKDANMKLNYFRVSDLLQPVAALPDNEVTTLLENKASPEGDDIPQDLASRLSDEIPSRAEFSHLDGEPLANTCELTREHAKSEPQTSQPVDMLQRRSPVAQHDMEAFHLATEAVLPDRGPHPQLRNPAMSIQNEGGISKDASLQFRKLEREATPSVYDEGAEHVTTQSIRTREVSEPQISNSALSMQNEDSISNSVIASKQSQVMQKGTIPTVSLDLGALPEMAQSVLPEEVPEHQISNPYPAHSK